MDNKRAAIVATAGVGLLVSALFLRKWNRGRNEHREEEAEKPVAVSDIVGQLHNHVADPVSRETN